MPEKPEWLFDESIQNGVDYTSESIAAEYDNEHSRFRDFSAEAHRIHTGLGLGADSVVVDIGCGTGGLSLALAPLCRHIYAVDISGQMLARLQQKTAAAGMTNITPCHAGFLTYRHAGLPADAVIANITLHHLPDFWKQIALLNFNRMLRPGGKLFIGDVVFEFEPAAYREELDHWLQEMETAAGPVMAAETVVHIREEFSTWGWIMEGLLERAGFSITAKHTIMNNMTGYLCEKRGTPGP